MIDPSNRLYALDLLHRAGTSYDARDISVIASILPLIEADIVETIEKPVGKATSGTQAIVASRIAAGCHRPNPESPGSLTSRPGQPAAAPDVHSGGGGLSGESPCPPRHPLP